MVIWGPVLIASVTYVHSGRSPSNLENTSIKRHRCLSTKLRMFINVTEGLFTWIENVIFKIYIFNVGILFSGQVMVAVVCVCVCTYDSSQDYVWTMTRRGLFWISKIVRKSLSTKAVGWSCRLKKTIIFYHFYFMIFGQSFRSKLHTNVSYCSSVALGIMATSNRGG